MKTYYVYIMSNKHNTTLYVGVTSDLVNRVLEHKNHYYKGFTSRYNCEKLVYFEEFTDIEKAILREKKLKQWHRPWKDDLIDRVNPARYDLSGVGY